MQLFSSAAFSYSGSQSQEQSNSYFSLISSSVPFIALTVSPWIVTELTEEGTTFLHFTEGKTGSEGSHPCSRLFCEGRSQISQPRSTRKPLCITSVHTCLLPYSTGCSDEPSHHSLHKVLVLNRGKTFCWEMVAEGQDSKRDRTDFTDGIAQ